MDFINIKHIYKIGDAKHNGSDPHVIGGDLIILVKTHDLIQKKT